MPPKPDYPNRHGTRKPHAAAKHVPEGHVPMITCPTCKGAGKIPDPKANGGSAKAMALGRA